MSTIKELKEWFINTIKEQKEYLVNTIKDALVIGTATTIIVGSCLGATASQTVVERPSITFSCQTEELYSFIRERRDGIITTSEKHGVSPLLIAATIMNENECRRRYDDWGDEIGLLIGANTSIGIGQVKIDTARELYYKYMGKKISREVAAALLKDPYWSINFIAMFYRNQMEYSKINYNQLQHPEIIFELMRRYVGGGYGRSREAEFSAFNGLLHIMDERLWDALGREYNPEMRDKILKFANMKKKEIKKEKEALSKGGVNGWIKANLFYP